jgi:malic enzyme
VLDSRRSAHLAAPLAARGGVAGIVESTESAHALHIIDDQGKLRRRRVRRHRCARPRRLVKWAAPSFGGINLEDIAAPRCFEVERRLREELDIPVFHDDQHGTAIVTLAALLNALRVVGKRR